MLLQKATTALAGADKYHPHLRAALEAVQDVAVQARALGHIQLVGEGPALAWVKDLVTHHGMGVCSVPYLSPAYCDELVEAFNAAGYEVNHEEEKPAQIPEIVLFLRCKPLYDCLSVLWQHAAVPLANIIWNLNPEVLGSVQAAQYSPEEQPGTVLHHDYHSDVTLVVNLGTDFVGGGTEVVGGLFDDAPVVLPPLLKGHAMFFKGKTQLHRGLPVTDGTRTLLVHWANLA